MSQGGSKGTNPDPVLTMLRETPEGNRPLYVGTDALHKMLNTAIEGIQILRKVRPQVRLFLTLRKIIVSVGCRV